MADLRIKASVSVEAQDAAAKLDKLKGGVAGVADSLGEAKSAAGPAAAEIGKVGKAANDTATGASRAANELRNAAAAEAQAGAAAGAAARGFDQAAQAQGRLAVSAGQARASTANLGQQIGDITQGLAAGINPATIFAQQAGQVAFAVQGMGGVLGTVGTFLSGPWGALLLGATTIAATFGTALFRAAEAGDAAARGAERHAGAATNLRDAITDLDKATGRYNLSQRETINLDIEAVKRTLASALAKREELKATLALAQANLDATNRAGAANPFGGFRVNSLEGQIAANDQAINDTQGSLRAAEAVRGLQSVKEATDKAAAATGAYERAEASLRQARIAGDITQKEYETGLTAAITDRDRALATIRESTKAAGAAQREHNKDLRDAARDAKAATKEILDFNAAVAAGVRRVANDQIGATANSGFADAIARQQSEVARDSLSAAVKQAEQSLVNKSTEAGKGFGDTAAQGFRTQALQDASAIGQAIGGKAGDLIAQAASLIAAGRSGDFSGVGGPVGGLLSLAGQFNTGTGSIGAQFSEGLKSAFSKPLYQIGSTLSDAFGNGGKGFAGLVGQAAGGASVGGLVSGLAGTLGIKLDKLGSQIGGAIGSFIPIPGGEIIGSIIGGIIGGLGPTPRAFQNLNTDASGNIVQSFGGARGKGNAELNGQAQTIAAAFGDSLDKLVAFTGGSLRAGATIGAIGPAAGKFEFKTGNTTTDGFDRSGGTTQVFDTAEAAVAAGLQSVISRGLLGGISDAVKAALLSSTDIDKAVAEAGKVKSLEALLAGRANPFASVFDALEKQIAERNSTAARYGFDLVQIEKINGEDRAKAVQQTLAEATGSIKNLLNELKFGASATGSISERLTGLNAERSRLVALSNGGDLSQNDAIATVTQQIDALQKSAFGSTQGFADGRATSVSILNDLVSQTEARMQKAADDAAKANLATVAKLTEANASLDDQVALLGQSNALLQQIAGSLGGFSSGGATFALAAQVARQ